MERGFRYWGSRVGASGWFGSSKGVGWFVWLASSLAQPPPRIRRGAGSFCDCHDCFLVDSSRGWVSFGVWFVCGAERGVLDSVGGYVSSGLVRKV